MSKHKEPKLKDKSSSKDIEDIKDEEKSIQPHDKYFKNMLPEFLKDENAIKSFIPKYLLPKINLKSLKIEPESYIETNLSSSYSDVVCSFKTNDNNEDIFLQLVIEHQSTSDHWISLRLKKYSILLCERHKDKRKKLPLVLQAVIYNGKVKYNAPRSFWDLFDNPDQAKETFNEDYKFIDLYESTDTELNSKYNKTITTAGWLFLMKHIRDKDFVKRQFVKFLEDYVKSTEKGSVAFNTSMWYILRNIGITNLPEIKAIILEHLPIQGEKLMKSIAQDLEEKGIEKEKISNATKMLKKGYDLKSISEITGLSKDKLLKLKKHL